ncbi:restriction endonuclease subunit S [Marinobacter shengliensis]|uniref:restriction endonuclease subunit S n=1 Tax=Marinobacter shengliensis TaxID=1389223 RepID=UPI001E46804A|nr:restriction endonuclease subunit S [Marinobacter shengliensis]MCD1632018.1 restriction endonuclease subunit S [Marinobacter shengliensis]
MISSFEKCPDNWSMLRIEEIAIIQSGTGFPPDAQGLTNGTIPFLKVSDMNLPKNTRFIEEWNNSITEEQVSKLKAKILPPGAVIFPKIGGAIATNKKRVLTIPSCFDNNVMGLKAKQEVLDEYLYWLLQSIDLVAWSSSSSLPSMKASTVKEFLVPVPSMAQQKRIVEKLDALITRIDTAIEHLQESVTLADALSKNGLSEIFESLKDRYEVVPLSSVVKINSGIALPKLFKNGFSDGDIPFFKVAQMNNHHETMVASEITFNETVATEHKIKLFPKGSTLIPKRGGAILTNKKRLLLEDASYDSNIMGLKADESKISDDYLFAFMRTIDLANFVDASTIPQVNNKHIDQMQIPLASIEEQADVVIRVNLLVKKVEAMNSEIQSQLDDLHALKNSILDSAFKGEL